MAITIEEVRCCRKSFTFSLHSSSRRSAWNSSVYGAVALALDRVRVGRCETQCSKVGFRNTDKMKPNRTRPLDCFVARAPRNDGQWRIQPKRALGFER
jgi:hypothetical protein